MEGRKMQEMFQGMEYIYEVYKERSFSKAARKLFISQPSLSACVKRLEQRIGYPVFDRSTTPIRLTECGQEYIRAVEEIMAVENSFYNYVADFGELRVGHLKLGGSNLFSSYVLPKLIGRFKEKFPKVTIELVEETTANLEKLLAAGVLDLVVDNSRFDENMFGVQVYRKEHLLLAVPEHFQENEVLREYAMEVQMNGRERKLMKTPKEVPLEVFKKEPFLLLKPENDTRRRAIKICREHGFTPKVALELDQQVTSYNVTCSGLGISFVSDTLIRQVQPHPAVTYYKLAGDEAERDIYLYWKKGKYVSRAMEEFLRMAGKSDGIKDDKNLLLK